MKKLGPKSKFAIRLIVYLAAVYYLVSLLPAPTETEADINLMILYNPVLSGDRGYILEAYKSVLEEEGIPFKIEAPSFLLSVAPKELIHIYPAILMPDGIARALPSDLKFWMKEYLSLGGHLALIYDAGVQNLKGKYINRALFADLIGMNYVLYNTIKDPNDAYTSGYIQFKDQTSVDYFQIPPGKTDKDSFLVGYSHGRLTFPMARVFKEQKLKDSHVKAYGWTPAGDPYPVIVMKKVISGTMMYVNLPLGHLKANSDDLLLRSVLRTFMFRVVKIPHLAGTPDAKGGLVINWHLDSNGDWGGLSFMKNNGFFSDHITYSFHVTAGDYNDNPGDGLGFDACGVGKRYLQPALKYGDLGSHGGLAHNWFNSKVNRGIDKEEFRELIVENNKCLETLNRTKILEYSSPGSNHPQPLVTRILEQLDMIAYFYTGDSGSAPNRTFHNNTKVSDSVIAFPVLSMGQVASYLEMYRDGISPDELENWLNNVLDFVIRNRTIRLLYSHSYEIPSYYPEIIKGFILKVEQKVKEGKLNAQSMSYFANFTQHFLKTRYRFQRQLKSLGVIVEHPSSLMGIVVSVPIDRYKVPDLKGIEVRSDNDYYYLEIKDPVKLKSFQLSYRDDAGRDDTM